MKTLYIIGGTMGVGKTTVCRVLQKRLPRSVFLDGDWCWDMVPFQVTEETRAMVMDNICHVLNNFIRCSAYETILFCWVMHRQEILDELLGRLELSGCTVRNISLVCREEPLRRRLQQDIDAGIRLPDVIERSLARIPLYQALDTLKIDVSDCDAAAAAEQILALR